MKVLKSLLVLFLVLSFAACEEEDNITNPTNPGTTSGTTFIVVQDLGEGTTDAEYAISKMSVSGETASVEPLISLQTAGYPYDFKKDIRIDGDKLYIYNLLPDYKNKLVVFDINSKQIDTLPWATTNNENTWSAFGSAFDASNSYVYYIMREVSSNYNDWPGSYLCRYNINSGEFIQMANPSDFTLDQPEVGSDTEIGNWTSVHASDDGSNCVGSIMAWGTEGGMNHYDYDIVYRYYPENNTEDKLERIGTGDMAVSGSTSGNKYVYQNSNVTNTETGEYFVLSEVKYLSTNYTGYQNANGTLKISNYYGKDIYIYYADIENDVQTLVVETYPEIQFAQMDKSGNFIWFGIEGNEENILCKTQDLSEGSIVDTVARYPKSVYCAIMK